MEVITNLMILAFLVLITNEFAPLFIGEKLPCKDLIFVYLLCVFVFMILTYSPIIRINADISF